MAEQFELRFEGPVDDSAPTLRRIKGVFVADLEFPASDVQKFLENAPITIKSATSEDELKNSFELLTRAGAKVLIVKACNQNNLEPNSTLDLSPLELDFDSVLPQPAKEIVPHLEDSEKALELNFDFDSTPVEKPQDVKINEAEQKTESFFGELSLDLSFDQDETKNTDLSFTSTENSPLDNYNSDLLSISSSEELEQKVTSNSNSSHSKTEELDIGGLELEVPETSTIFGSHTPAQEPEAVEPEVEIKTLDAKLSEIQTITEKQVSNPCPEPEPQAKQEEYIQTNNLDSDEDEPIELTLQELKALQRSPKRKAKLKQGIIGGTFVSLGAVVLFFLNQALFSGKISQNPFTALLEQIPDISSESQKESKEKLEKKSKELAETTWYTSEQNFSNRSIKASVWVEKNRPLHGSIEVSTPQPPPLTKEEIVNNVAPRPWLRRLDIKDLLFKQEGEKWLASGPALAYFSIGDKNLRVPGVAWLKASISEDQKNLELEIQAKTTQEPLENQVDQAILEFNTEQSKPSFKLIEKLSVLRQ